MENRIELPLELAYNRLNESLSNWGFIVREVNGGDNSRFRQIIFSVSTHPQNHEQEYFLLSASGQNSTVLQELDLTGRRWSQPILARWNMLDSAYLGANTSFEQAA